MNTIIREQRIGTGQDHLILFTQDNRFSICGVSGDYTLSHLEGKIDEEGILMFKKSDFEFLSWLISDVPLKARPYSTAQERRMRRIMSDPRCKAWFESMITPKGTT